MLSDQTMFTVFCFLIRTTSAIGGAASETSSMSIIMEKFPDNVGAVTVCVHTHACMHACTRSHTVTHTHTHTPPKFIKHNGPSPKW